MTASQKLVAAVRVVAQLLPTTSALAQWLNEIETSRILERLDKLEDPLTRYGRGAKELSRKLYALVEAQAQDVPTTHVDYTPDLKPFIKESISARSCLAPLRPSYLDGRMHSHASTTAF
jgi:hypothetical protein